MSGAPRAAGRFGFCGFISITREIARGVTAMVVGSGALLGRWFIWEDGSLPRRKLSGDRRSPRAVRPRTYPESSDSSAGEATQSERHGLAE
jgi:hypothetical protein